MNWSSLKENKCPMCISDLKHNPSSAQHECTNCDFRIGAVKFDKIVGDLFKPKRRCATGDSIEKNLSDLNNL